MAATPGLCLAAKTCQTARLGRIVAITLGDPFECPECKSALVPPAQLATTAPAKRRMPPAMLMGTMGAGLFVLGGAIFLGRQLGTVPATSVPAPAAPVMAATAPTMVIAATRPAVTPAAPASSPAQTVTPQPAAATMLAGNQPDKPATAAAAAIPPAAQPATQPATLPANMPAGPSAPQPLPAPVTMPDVVALQPAPVPAPALPTLAPAPAPAAPELAAGSAPAALPDAPFSPVPQAGGAPAYPAELAADGKPGRVNVTCQIQLDGTPAGCKAVAKTGGAAFANATLAWLNHGHVRFHPIVAHGKPASGTRSWTVNIEEPASMLADARRKQHDELAANAPPPAAAAHAEAPPAVRVQPALARIPLPASSSPELQAGSGVTRPFSTRVVAGGAPVFPAYYDDTRPGAVNVTCTIDTHGVPGGCHVLHAAGGKAFGAAVQNWLSSGRVRFSPILENGTPVARQETWTVVFNHVPEE